MFHKHLTKKTALANSSNDDLLEGIFYQLIENRGTAVDIIVEGPERFNELKDKWFPVHSEIAKHGMVIYEK